MKKLQLKPLMVGTALCLAGAVAQATPFETDVATSIDRGIAKLATDGAYNNPSSAGDAAGLTALALMEKRASGIPSDPPQGYVGASLTDQGRLRKAAAYMIGRSTLSSYSYRTGNYLMALSLYLRTGGPDRGAHPDLSAALPYTLIGAINKLTDDLVANQAVSGYWCYTSPGCNDSSTTQFAVAGLASAKAVYSDPAYPDVARLAAVNAALAKARLAYQTHAGIASPGNGNNTGSDNGGCFIIEAAERGHGYNAYVGYKPSLQQTASATWVQILGNADINDGTVQSHIRWLRNHYRYTDLDSMGNSWPGNSYWYYLWSSFKGMEFLNVAGVAPNPGNLGPNDMGTLPPDAACGVRQLQRDPAVLSRVASFGAGGVGYYSGEPKNQYFDYAYSILGYQCADGNYSCNGAPGYWNYYSHNAYALLVLQRATGGACNDTDADGVCDDVDNCTAVYNPSQKDTLGFGVGDACQVRCDYNGDKAISVNPDINAIKAMLNKKSAFTLDPRDADRNGVINVLDARTCSKYIGSPVPIPGLNNSPIPEPTP